MFDRVLRFLGLRPKRKVIDESPELSRLIILARRRRELPLGINLVDKFTLGNSSDVTWRETDFSKLTPVESN